MFILTASPKGEKKLHNVTFSGLKMKNGKVVLTNGGSILYFVISNYVEADKGIEEDLLDRVYTMLFGPSFVPGTIEKAIKDIKSILETGEKNAEDEDVLGGRLMEMIARIASDPEMAKAMMSDPDAPQELRGVLTKMLGDTADSSEKQKKEGDEDGI